MIKNEFRQALPYNLQFFADGGDAATVTSADSGNGESTATGEGTVSSFDELLKDPKNQSEFDKKISKALETAKGKWEVDSQLKIEAAKTEAEKLSKMKADEKAEYEAKKKEQALSDRERTINTRELKAQASETLIEKGLPKSLADILNYENADSCNKSIDSVEKAFQSAVEKAVNEKLRGTPPKDGTPGGTGFNFAFSGVRPKK